MNNSDNPFPYEDAQDFDTWFDLNRDVFYEHFECSSGGIAAIQKVWEAGTKASCQVKKSDE